MSRKVKYSYKFKLSCVKAVVELHQPILYVRGKYNVPKTLLTRWLTVYRQVGLIGLQSKKIMFLVRHLS